MLIIKRYLSFALGILTFIFLESFIFFPRSIYYSAWLYLIILFLGLRYLQKGNFKNISEKIAYFILPIVLMINWICFLTYQNFSQKITLHILTLLAAVVIWLYVESSFLKRYFVRFYRPNCWENAVEEIIIIVAFLTFMNFFGLEVYVNWKPHILFIVAGIILLFLNWNHLVFNKFLDKENFLIYLFVIPALSLEILFVSTFLPTNFYSLALINVLMFYLLIIFSRYHLSGRFSAKMVRRYLSLSVILLLAILFISNWT